MCEQVDPRPILGSIPWFSDLEPEHFEKMVEIAKVCDLEPGQEGAAEDGGPAAPADGGLYSVRDDG